MNTTIPPVKAFMTAFPQHIDSQASMAEAEQLMKEKQVRHLVVTHKNGGFSLLSDRDLQHHRVLYGGDVSSDLIVEDVCIDQAVCADLNDPVDQVLNAMADRHLGSVVILREAELAGIFTTTDACRHFANFLREQCSGDDSPDLIA